MKKLIYTGKFLTILSLVLLTGCKKDSKVDFPKQTYSNGTTSDFTYGTPTIPNFSDANGIMTAVHTHNYRIVTVSPVEKEFQYGIAQFTNTTGNFSVLQDADSVFVNWAMLTKYSNFWYESDPSYYSMDFTDYTSWRVKGSGTVPAMTYTMNINDPSYTFLSTSGTYWNDAWVPTFPKNPAVNHADSVFNVTPFAVIPIKAYVTNADSVYIIFSDGASFNYTKRVPATDSIVSLKPTDFAGYPSYSLTNLTLQINVVKYNSTMVAGKKYYFLKMGSYIKYWKASS